MNIYANERFELIENALKTLVTNIKSKMNYEHTSQSFDETLFDKCILEWQTYRKSHAEYKANGFKGGTMFPLIYASDLTTITEEKIES